MIVLHRGKKVLAGGLGKSWATPHHVGHKGMTCEKSPSTGARDKYFLWLLQKEEKTKEHMKAAPKAQGRWENRVLCTEITQLFIKSVAHSSQGEAQRQSSKAQPGGPTFHSAAARAGMCLLLRAV